MRILFLLRIRVFPTLLVGPVFRGVNLENGCTDGSNDSRIKIYFFLVGYMNVFGYCDPFSNVKIELKTCCLQTWLNNKLNKVTK